MGNDPGDARLEATISGPELGFTGATWVAITGADMDPHLNGQGIPMNKEVDVRPGDRLGFRGLRTGCRSYIAFAGGIAVPLVIGSRQTYLRAGIGGFMGRALMPGDELALGGFEPLSPPGQFSKSSSRRKPRFKKIPEDLIPEYKHEQTIRVISGPEANYFEIASLRSFLSTEYTVTAQSDLMGYRLTGEPTRHKEGMNNIISAGISLGTIQIPDDGQPIILMADRQTSGGYARIANVITADLILLAQRQPGSRLRFKEISLGKEQQLNLIGRSSLLKRH